MERSSKTVTKRDLIDEVFYNQKNNFETHLFRYMIEDIADILFEDIGEAIVEGKHVYLRGFGTFMPIRSGFTTMDKHVYNLGIIKNLNVFFNGRIFRPSKALLKKLNDHEDVYSAYFGDTTNN